MAEMGHSQGGREKWVPRHGAGSPGLNGWLRVRRSDPLRKARVDSAALPTAHSVSASRPTAALCPRGAVLHPRQAVAQLSCQQCLPF